MGSLQQYAREQRMPGMHAILQGTTVGMPAMRHPCAHQCCRCDVGRVCMAALQEGHGLSVADALGGAVAVGLDALI